MTLNSINVKIKCTVINVVPMLLKLYNTSIL